MSKLIVPQPVADSARALVEVSAAATRFLRGEGTGPALAVQGARVARKSKSAGQSALRSASSSWPRLLRIIGDACDELGWACEEANLLARPLPRRWERAATSLRDGAAGLNAALENSRGRSQSLIKAKKQAALAAGFCHEALQEARAEPNVVLELKLSGVGRRLSQAAESLQQAADVFTEILIQ